MSTLEEIIEWAQTYLTEWQSDAVRRLLTQDELSKADISEILTIIKNKHGIAAPGISVPKPTPPMKGKVSGATVQSDRIVLKAIENLSNVNAIPDGSRLPFGHKGLTVIYGQNGSGKSGYARILKRACNARDKKEMLLPNVFSADSISTGPAKATFKIAVNDEDKPLISWEDGIESDEILSNICVFDSKCARVIVDENNEVTYLPYGTHVFKDLSNLMADLRTILSSERPSPYKPTFPNVPQTTKAGLFLSSLSDSTSDAEIKQQAGWNKTDDEKLLSLRKLLALAGTDDPLKHAQIVRNLGERSKRLHEVILKVNNVIAESKAITLKETLDKLKLAEKTLVTISKEALSKEPLAGAGDPVWQKMYFAARDFSIQIAYPGKEFPYTGADSRCVLCMQPLSEDAKSRMIRFKNFLENKAKKEISAFEHQLSIIHFEIENNILPDPETYKDVLDEVRARNPLIGAQLEGYFTAVKKRQTDMIKAIQTKEMQTLTPIPSVDMAGLFTIAVNLNNEADAIVNSAQPEQLAKIKSEEAELLARKSLSERKNEITSYVEKLQLAKKYDLCINETNTRDITTKGKEIISRALTANLGQALEEELKNLGINYLTLSLKRKGTKGDTLHKMELEGSLLGDAINITDILSEGEQHVVALAGFLAELSIREHKCPIVLDDPVCSLDHVFREKIATRLAKESLKRQVLIFTHDIAFLLELESALEKIGDTHFTQLTVQKVGNCIGSRPWHTMKVKDRITYLIEYLDSVKNLHTADKDKYNKEAGFLYGLLREAWEAAVEEILFHNVVTRHQREIKTQELRYVVVENDDFTEIYKSMTKCSEWMIGHDKSKTLSVDRPSPPEIHEDIKSLSEFVSKVNKRNDLVQKDRKKLVEPKTTKIG